MLEILDKIKRVGKYTVIHIKRDISSIPDCIILFKEIDDLIENLENKFIALYFHKNSIISASSIGFILEKFLKVKNLHGQLVLIAPDQFHREMLDVTSINAVISVYKSLNSFKSKELRNG